MNARPRARLDADRDDQAVEPGDRHQRCARLHAVTLGDRDRRDDPVERRRQRLQRPVRAFPLQASSVACASATALSAWASWSRVASCCPSSCAA